MAQTVASIIAVVVSIAALATAVIFGIKQVRDSSKRSAAQVAMEMLTRESRSDAFMDSEDYVIRQLANEHSPDRGVLALPLNARKHVQRISYYYSDLAILTIYGGVSAELIVATVHRPIVRAWSILEPYIKAEREIRGNDRYLNFFEHLASVSADADVLSIHNKLGLRSFVRPGSQSANDGSVG
jgi:hypothetical protein